MSLTELLNLPFTPDQERLVWLGASLLLHVLGSLLAWMLSATRVWRPLRRFAVGPLRFAYFVGLPYAALLSGAVTLQALGIVGTAQAEHPGMAAAVALAGAVLITVWQYHLHRATRPLEPAAESPRPPGPSTRRWDWVFELIDAGYQEAHWAFYRGLPILLLQSVYAGAFVGLALILVEMLSDPATRYGLATPPHAERFALAGSLAVVSTVLFVLTGTSWAGAGAHLLTLIGVCAVTRVAKSASAPTRVTRPLASKGTLAEHEG